MFHCDDDLFVFSILRQGVAAEPLRSIKLDISIEWLLADSKRGCFSRD